MADDPRATGPAEEPTPQEPSGPPPATSQELAARHLHAAGIEIVCRSLRSPYVGLDLVIRDAGTTAFVTVITSANPGGGVAAESLSRTERRRIRRFALRWLADSDGPWQRIRFDVVSIVTPTDGDPLITHHKAVF
ncbi:YraN family protein [Nocardia carnea]|uniref:YraN family protein n=1 Tax=Nocardia carnea TaxID=37328 RepID=UPI00245586A9|nr:YraN family protein [Nocardia carnea]